MQNSFTFNGFNSIDLFDQTESPDLRSERRNSLSNIDTLNQANFSSNLATSQLMFNTDYNFPLNNNNSDNTGNNMEQILNNNSSILQYMYRQQQEQRQQFNNSVNFNNEFGNSFPDQSNMNQFNGQMILPPHRPQVKGLKPEIRRNSFCASTLRPVHESRPSSPVLFFRELKNQKNQQIQQKIESNFNKDAALANSKYNRKSSLTDSFLFKSKFRGTSIGKS